MVVMDYFLYFLHGFIMDTIDFINKCLIDYDMNLQVVENTTKNRQNHKTVKMGLIPPQIKAKKKDRIFPIYIPFSFMYNHS